MVAQNYFEYFPTQRKMFSIIFPAQRSFYSSKSPKKVYFHRSSIPRRSMYKNSLSIGLESCFKNQNVLTLLVQGVFYVLHMFHKNLRNFCFLVSNTYWNKPNSGPFFVLFQGCSKEICFRFILRVFSLWHDSLAELHALMAAWTRRIAEFSV